MLFGMEVGQRRRPFWHYVLVAAAIALMAALVERAMGRVWVSKTGRLMLWNGVVASPENSQQFFDWYSFSHVIHGIVFYAVLHLVGRRLGWPVGVRLVIAVAIEVAWEVFENTPFTIERYRKATIALDYYGDSVLNSMCDVACCVAGFVMAWRLPVWGSVAVVVVNEAFVGYMIRDNLTLNIIMLIHPVEAIKRWQSGGG
jgi:hypothetical protein